jgi:hypothetical protein
MCRTKIHTTKQNTLKLNEPLRPTPSRISSANRRPNCQGSYTQSSALPAIRSRTIPRTSYWKAFDSYPAHLATSNHAKTYIANCKNDNIPKIDTCSCSSNTSLTRSRSSACSRIPDLAVRNYRLIRMTQPARHPRTLQRCKEKGGDPTVQTLHSQHPRKQT